MIVTAINKQVNLALIGVLLLTFIKSQSQFFQLLVSMNDNNKWDTIRLGYGRLDDKSTVLKINDILTVTNRVVASDFHTA